MTGKFWLAVVALGTIPFSLLNTDSYKRKVNIAKDRTYSVVFYCCFRVTGAVLFLFLDMWDLTACRTSWLTNQLIMAFVSISSVWVSICRHADFVRRGNDPKDCVWIAPEDPDLWKWAHSMAGHGWIQYCVHALFTASYTVLCNKSNSRSIQHCSALFENDENSLVQVQAHKNGIEKLLTLLCNILSIAGAWMVKSNVIIDFVIKTVDQ